jgi:hypothetical protein
MESNGDLTLLDSELKLTEIMQDEITPAGATNWDDADSRASDSTSMSHHSRSAADADYLHLAAR